MKKSVEEFLAEREASLAGLTDEEIEEIIAESLEGVDPGELRAEVEAHKAKRRAARQQTTSESQRKT